MLRPVEPSDTEAVRRLIASIYAEYDCVLDLEGVDSHLIVPGADVRAKGGDFWVVERHEAIEATCAVALYPDHAELKTLYVHPERRRRGWGSALVRFVARYVVAKERRRIVLWSDTRFHDAHRLYEGLGFRRFGTRELHDLNQTTEFGFELDDASPLASTEG
ncbi:MAG: GNAT family N-acetyltransferase [Myxococcales bacterium]|nr:GNAT family N-acetyltransferase [Myxococcales bacterium]